MASVQITVSKTVAESLRREAEKLGVSVDEYLLELVTQGLDPENRAVEYIKAARELLEQARGELRRGTLGRRLRRHGVLWLCL